MHDALRQYLRLLATFGMNPHNQYNLQEVVRVFEHHRGSDALKDLVGVLYQTAEFGPADRKDPLRPPATESSGEHWDPSDDGWEYQQHDTVSSSTLMRRKRVETGWLYQVRDNASDQGQTLYAWHPPVFVPAPAAPPKPPTEPLPPYTGRPLRRGL